MSRQRQWITPFLKQCFVTAGVSFNTTAIGLVIGFASGLLEQLDTPESIIPIDVSTGSWIAAFPAFFLVVGNLMVISIMGQFGRKKANLISIALLIAGWIGIYFSTNVTLLLVARAVQGVFMGMITTLGPLLIGEYASPSNRGALLMTVSISISFGVLIVHILGSYLSWQTGAVICAAISFLDLLIVFSSPESPSWLASQGKYEDCKRVFRCLRGDGEEQELLRMIEANVNFRESQAEANLSESIFKKVQKGIVYFNTSIRKREFYRPLIIMVHIYTISLWGGVNVISVYATDMLQKIVSIDANVPLLIITLDVQRICSNIFAIYIVKKMKRRPMLFTTVGINIAALFATAAYSYAKEKHVLLFDHPMIGILLTHCMLFAIATGSLSLAFIIAGEIFPLEFKNLAGGLSVVTCSANMFINLKTIPYCYINFGIYGTYCISALILCYCLWVAWVLLPETKDRTLQDIEEEFRGRLLSPQELKSAQSLTSWKDHDPDGRCSTPSIN